MRSSGRLRALVALALAIAAPAPDLLHAASRDDVARAARKPGPRLEIAPRAAGSDTSLTCFEGSLTEILNPGCFFLSNPPTGGDCVSHDEQYFIQYLTPNFSTPQRITGFGFISNDGATVFPRAGIVLIPTAQNRFPTMAELAALQVQNVPTPHDTAVVIVDLRDVQPALVVTPGTDIVVCLRFPEATSATTEIGTGPGIAVDSAAPDQDCDYFTLNGGATWASNDFGDDPLDWGFEVGFEPALPVEQTTWSDIKRLYGGDSPTLYRNP